MSEIIAKLPIPHLATLLGIAVVAALAAWSALSPGPVLAYEEMIGLDCDQDAVVEGQTYRLQIYREDDSQWWHDETMKVFWSTQSGTATENDYKPLNHEGHASNAFQTRVGRMGRTWTWTGSSSVISRCSPRTNRFRCLNPLAVLGAGGSPRDV